MSIPEKIHIDWSAYDPGECFDAIIGSDGRPRPPAVELARALGALSPKKLADRQQAAENAILEMGITFTVYSEGQNIDRAWPFNIVPRPIAREEWTRVEAGSRASWNRATSTFAPSSCREGTCTSPRAGSPASRWCAARWW